MISLFPCKYRAADYFGLLGTALILFGMAVGKNTVQAATDDNKLCLEDVTTRNAMLGDWNSITKSGSEYKFSIKKSGPIDYSGNAFIVGKLTGQTFTGCWIRKNKLAHCGQKFHGSRYWGRVVFTFDSKFEKFTGFAGVCDDKPENAWNGTLVKGTDTDRVVNPPKQPEVAKRPAAKPKPTPVITPPKAVETPVVVKAKPVCPSCAQDGITKQIDRPGGNYHSFLLRRPEVEFCRTACIGDKKCRAWTFVKQGHKGASSAMCYLKSSVPVAIPATWAISGTVE